MTDIEPVNTTLGVVTHLVCYPITHNRMPHQRRCLTESGQRLRNALLGDKEITKMLETLATFLLIAGLLDRRLYRIGCGAHVAGVCI